MGEKIDSVEVKPRPPLASSPSPESLTQLQAFIPILDTSLLLPGALQGFCRGSPVYGSIRVACQCISGGGVTWDPLLARLNRGDDVD